MREEKTFRVVVFRFETDASTNYTRYMITKNLICFCYNESNTKTKK